MAVDKLTGIIPAPITPFTQKGDIDEGALSAYVNWLVENGVHGLFCYGSFGGWPLMRIDERKRAAEVTIKAAAGRIPVVIHVGAMETKTAAELAKHAADAGAWGVASLPPVYYPVKEPHIRRYFAALREASKLPVYAYNFPAKAGYSLEPDMITALADDGLAGVKDSSLNIIYTQHALNALGDRKFNWVNGTVPVLMAAVMLGAEGSVAGTANAFPEFTVSLWDAIQAKNFDEARKIQRKLTTLVSVMNKPINVVGVHTMLKLRGLDFAGYPREPLVPATEEQIATMKRELQELELL